MQDPSSGGNLVISQKNKCGFFVVLVGIDVVNIMAAYQPVVQVCGSL